MEIFQHLRDVLNNFALQTVQKMFSTILLLSLPHRKRTETRNWAAFHLGGIKDDAMDCSPVQVKEVTPVSVSDCYKLTVDRARSGSGGVALHLSRLSRKN